MHACLDGWAMPCTVRYSIVDKDTHVGEKLSDRSGWDEDQRDGGCVRRFAGIEEGRAAIARHLQHSIQHFVYKRTK